MADILSQLIEGFQSGLETQRGTQDRMLNAQNKLAEIGLRQQQLEANKQELAARKEQLEAEKVKRVLDYYDFSQKMADPNLQKLASENLPGIISRYGAEGSFSPFLVEAMQKSPETRLRIQTLADEVASGKLTLQEALGIANDPEKLTKVQPAIPAVSEAQRTFLEQQTRVQASGASAGLRAAKDMREDADNLRKELTSHPITKNSITIQESFQRVKEGLIDMQSAAGDLKGIFAYMKMLDPGSTVREGEFANAQNAAGVPDQIRALWNKLKSGERLTDAQRKDFFSQAEQTLAGQKNMQNALNKEFTQIAKSRGHNPHEILAGTALPTPEQKKRDIPETLSVPGKGDFNLKLLRDKFVASKNKDKLVQELAAQLQKSPEEVRALLEKKGN